MNLSAKSIGWHLGSMAAAGWAVLVFAQSNAVDVYAIIGQLKKTWGELIVLFTMLGPVFAIAGAAYRTYAMKQVPKEAVAILPHTPQDAIAPKGAPAAGTVVGCLLMLFLLMPSDAQAGKATTCSACKHGCTQEAYNNLCGPVVQQCSQPNRGWFDKSYHASDRVMWQSYWECLHGLSRPLARKRVEQSGMDAYAQGPIARKIIASQTGDASGGIEGLIAKFYAVTETDLALALEYARFGEDRAAISCYTEWLAQVKGMNDLRSKFPDPEGVQLITLFQKARNLIKRLDTDSPVRQACAALAQDAKTDVKTLITKLVSGMAIKAFLPF